MKKIKIKSQPRWVVRIFILLGVLLGGILAFVSHPIGGTNAQSAQITSDFMYYETVDGIGTITICDYNDPNACITMMDMNLGASKSGTTCSSADTGACGNHYQRGNNYGFANPGVNGQDSITSSAIVGVISTIGYGPGNYFNSGIFRKTLIYPYDWSSSQNDNLRGGNGDNQSNNRGYSEINNEAINVEDRRGPCDTGYHIPSAGEWGTLLKYWAGNYILAGNSLVLSYSNGLPYFTNNNTAAGQFQEDFMIPFAGYHKYSDAQVYNIGTNPDIWLSSPYGESSRMFGMNSSNVRVDGAYERANAYSIRCFKDTAITPPLPICSDGTHLEGGYCVDNTKSVPCAESGEIPENSTYISEIVIGTRNIGTNSRDTPTCSWTCGDGYHEEPSTIGTITVCDPNDSTKCITMQDRNLGASKSGTTCSSADTGACGNHYQRGNNYGFVNPGVNGADNITSSAIAGTISTAGYGPGNYFSGSIFRKISNSPHDWSSPKNNNLRGGSGDSSSNGYGYPVTNASERQGPCPDSYHIPSAGERGTLLQYWAGNYILAGNSLVLSYSNGLPYFTNNNTAAGQFQEDFMIPFAGSRNYGSAKIDDVGSNANLWSSSPYSMSSSLPYSTFARDFYMTSSLVNTNDSNIRASGRSVRCFKDSALGPSSSEGGDVGYVHYMEVSTLSCKQNQMTGLCAQTGTIPTNSSFNIVDTTRTRNNGTDSRDIPICSWSCNEYYHQSGDFCEVDSLTFDPNGGSTDQQVITATMGYSSIKLPNAWREGYKFLGWYTEAEGGERVGGCNDSYTITRNITLYAHWELNPTVTFDGNGGTTSLSSTTVENNTLIKLPNAFREGYKFLGWYTDPDLGERVGGYNSSYIVTADITLYAHWELNPTVTFDGNGGTTNLSSTTVERNTSIELPNAFREGYKFLGWYTNSDGGERVGGYNSSYIVTADITLYAHWELNPTVTFDENWGTTSLSSTTVENNTSIELPNAFREGYKFLGWYTDPDGGERVGGYNSSYIVTADITLYAHWEKYLVVTFDFNGGEGNSGFTYTLLDQLISPKRAKRDGYTLDGRYTSDGKKRDFSVDTVQGDMTLYAKRRVCGEGFVVEDNRCVPKGMELNGVIKVTDGDRTMYIRDRNVGVTSDAAVIYLKINTIENQNGKLWDNQCYNQCYNQCNNEYNNCYYECFDECYSQNFVETVGEELGISYENINEAYNSLYIDILEGVLPEKEMEAFLLNMEANSIFYQCEGNEDATCGQSEVMEYINTTFELEQELQEWDDVTDWLIEYFGADDFEEFNERYNNGYYRNLADRQVDGNYYYRGNNSGVNYNDLEFGEDEWGNTTNEIINMGELVAKGFDGGKMGVEGQGWISGNVNPCNPEKGEFLPTPEDWKNLMEIWGNSNGYEIIDDSCIDSNNCEYYSYDYYFDNYNDGFESDMLIPYGGFIDNGNFYRDTELWSSQNKSGLVGDYYRGHIEYAHYTDHLNGIWRPGNNVAMPVRCFVNPTEIPDVYVVSYETNEGSEINDVNVINGDTVNLPTPSRDGYTFLGWYTDQEYTRPFTATEPITSDTVLYAKWQDNATNTGVQPITSTNGGRLRKDKCPDGDFSDSYYDGSCGTKPKDKKETEKNENQHNAANNEIEVENVSPYQRGEKLEYDTLKYNPKYSDEMNQAYQYAYYYGITTKESIKSADVNGNLTRVAMAKMLSQYAINVLGLKPDKTMQNKFADVSDKLNSSYDNGVTLAYQLGIMGINMPDNKFRPYDTVTRAEFATALSRMKYNISDGEYSGTSRYYTPHMQKLLYEGIITNTDPALKELRGYVMLMLMRSAK